MKKIESTSVPSSNEVRLLDQPDSDEGKNGATKKTNWYLKKVMKVFKFVCVALWESYDRKHVNDRNQEYLHVSLN